MFSLRSSASCGLLLLSLMAGACDSSSISVVRAETEFQRSSTDRHRSTKPSLQLNEATIKINGELRVSRVTISDDTFSFLFFWVDEEGLFLVSAARNEAFTRAGEFAGRLLSFAIPGYRIEVENEDRSLLKTNLVRDAWVQHIRDFEMFEGSDNAPGMVIGLVDHFWQIPWYDQYLESMDR